MFMRPSVARQRMDMSAARTSSLPQNVLPSLNELKEAVFPNSRKNDIGAKCWSLFLSQGGARSTRGRALVLSLEVVLPDKNRKE